MKMHKNTHKTNRNSDTAVPKDFTLALALADAVPVLEFSAGMLLIARKFKSKLFLLGAAMSTAAGCGKVLWKLIIACKKKNIVFLNRQFRYLMSGGFLTMLLSVIVRRDSFSPEELKKKVLQLPAAAFFAAGTGGFAAMIGMAKKLDKENAKHNWIEQSTNIFSQTMILLGICTSFGK